MGVHYTPTKNCWDFFVGLHVCPCTPMGVQLCGRTNFLWAYNVRPCTPMGVQGVLGVICGRTGRTWAYKGVHGRNIAGAFLFFYDKICLSIIPFILQLY